MVAIPRSIPTHARPVGAAHANAGWLKAANSAAIQAKEDAALDKMVRDMMPECEEDPDAWRNA